MKTFVGVESADYLIMSWALAYVVCQQHITSNVRQFLKPRIVRSALEIPTTAGLSSVTTTFGHTKLDPLLCRPSNASIELANPFQVWGCSSQCVPLN